jgi:sulfide:quinone oxidoreductase
VIGPRPLQVLVAGGGVAGLEALLALRDLAGERVELTLLSPEAEFVYRPMAVAEPWPMPQTCQAVISASS